MTQFDSELPFKKKIKQIWYSSFLYIEIQNELYEIVWFKNKDGNSMSNWVIKDDMFLKCAT